MTDDDLRELPLAELFRLEAEVQLAALTEGTIRLESSGDVSAVLTDLMRAAHSLKGAARVVGSDEAVRVAHAMEDVMVRSKRDPSAIAPATVDTLLAGIDCLRGLSTAGEEASAEERAAAAAFCARCAEAPAATPTPGGADSPPRETRSESGEFLLPRAMLEVGSGTPPADATGHRSTRVPSSSLDRLVGIAGETRILLREMQGFADEADGLVRAQRAVDASLAIVSEGRANGRAPTPPIADFQAQAGTFRARLSQHVARLQDYDLRAGLLADRLYAEALACRMRPFGDILPGLRRLSRDVARQLGKPVRFVVTGAETQVDREILEKVEEALIHLLRNALDHGVETVAERQHAGKAAEATLTLGARQFGGRLVVRVSDDGRGIALETVRRKLAAENFLPRSAVEALSPAEVFEFLFLPEFSLRDHVTELSGRGVGLDAVQTTIRALRGSVRLSSQLGEGATFELSVPLSLSVARCLLVEIAGEPWAFALSRLQKLVRIPTASVETTAGRAFWQAGTERMPLVPAATLLGLSAPPRRVDELSVVVVTNAGRPVGLVVERFLQSLELALQPLPPELGRLRHVTAVSVLADGSPVLVLDEEDLARSSQDLADVDLLKEGEATAPGPTERLKRILVVEDSLTVRELERKLLLGCGYHVETAVDGVDGWDKLRAADFDLLVTDIDMPRMDGIELLRQVRATPRFEHLPVMIVSSKDRPEDRQRGLEAGADHYLGKSGFHEEALTQAAEELIGAGSP